ncbi:phage tail tape measure protein [Paenibacillus chitinolyticus]|uniref:Phage tail tape measure protein n=1 Tax=Paenibacillus chitinolyticus TaxID=79263 RepID=A0A410X0Y2_9BACL|nr:phage tail tape measure protein [Paenibacillus chitinolyticus]MCY9593719.1 phage tail tape measure protein [Paenibacillus chitinolyticus]MCY9599715.1 phage tail tape measure protein [Paenibacillus chitinolyticus]QAV20112.1 phage tail tape measure protein [Paenibacillus chitinolyticus]
MAMNEKDVVGARLKLDTSKLLPAFQVIDGGAKKNAESFRLLNNEIAQTERVYGDLAKAMDKSALSAEERRKKILDESRALVEQRTAQAELLRAKKESLEATNQVVEAKLATQEAIVKKRNQAIEQQEREHLQRMQTLQSKSQSASSQEALAQAKLDQKLQQIQQSNAREEREAERHAQRMNQISQQTGQMVAGPSIASNLGERLQQAALHATVYQGIYAAIHATQQAIHDGLVKIESNMAGYVQTNEHYFVSFNKSTGEMVMNTQRLNEETTKFIQTAHDLGADINDVTESARLWGRMYKDVNVVQEMVRQSTKLSTVDMVALSDSTKMMEAVMAQYAVHIGNANDAMVIGNRVLDSWSKVAHDTMAPARDLGAAFERTGKIASETGVSFDFMNGLISAGIRNTALSGENLGNMWKTVLGTIRTDKAVKELEELDVRTKEVVNGVEQWRKAEDILLDLSVKVIDKNYDLTKSYADISRGVYQFAKLAASLNVGDILLGQSASINSTGSTMEYLKVQMDTIERKAKQTKTSLLAIFNQAGEDGLRTTIKNALDVLDQLLIGLTKVPKEVYQGTAALAGLVVAYKAIYQPIMSWVAAERALSAAKSISIMATNAETTAIYAQTAAMAQAARMTALATGGLTLLVGVISLYVFNLGAAEKAERNQREEMEKKIAVQEQMINQTERQSEFLTKAIDVRNQLTQALKNQSLTEEQKNNITNQLSKTEQAITAVIGEEGLQRLKTAGYTKEAIQAEKEAIESKRQVMIAASNEMIRKDQQETQTRIAEAKKRMAAMGEEMKVLQARANMQNSSGVSSIKKSVFGFFGLSVPETYTERLLGEKQNEYNKLQDTINEGNARLNELSGKLVDNASKSLDPLSGMSGKGERNDSTEDQKKSFQAEMNKYRHLVNMKKEGYVSAADQAKQLKAIRDKYKGSLSEEDLYGIDEDIFRAGEGVSTKAKGFSAGKQPKAPKAPKQREPYKFPLDAIDKDIKEAKMVVDSADSVIDFYNAKRGAMSGVIDDYAQRIELFDNRQKQLHVSNESLRASLGELQGKQAELNRLYKNGTITLDEYNRFSEDVTTRIASLTKEIDANSIAWWNDAKAIKEVKEQQIQDSFEFSEKWISHQKAIGELAAEGELAAWKRVQARYLEGTEQRKRADEQVYAAKKALMQEEESRLKDKATKEEKSVEESFKTQKKLLNDLKKAELDAIKTARDQYVDAQDAKIKALEKLIQLEDESNEDDDYEAELAKKKARAKLLEDAVGPEGKKERRDLLVEIEKMEEEHRRKLRKRGLESLKEQYQEEKTAKEKEFDEKKQAVETHYDSLLNVFDQFKNDVEGRAEALKQLQILKESEKNAEILKQLDAFIDSYKSKMTTIAGYAPADGGETERERDLRTYNSNIDKWYAGDDAEKARVHDENQHLRWKYGIEEDTGKLQHFSEGGIVRGKPGDAVRVVAHADELILNPAQQGNLFRLLNMGMPKIQYDTSTYSKPAEIIQKITYNYEINSGDVNLSDEADIKSYWRERDVMVRRFQSRGGVKTV